MAGGTEVEVELREWPMPVVKGRQRGTRWRFICMRCGASRDALHFVDGEWDVAGKIVWTRSVLDTLAVTDKDTAPRLRGAHGYCASSCAFDQGA